MQIQDLKLSNKRLSSTRLRIFLVKNGFKQEKCESCNLSEWMTLRIPLELHHVDGNPLNNNFENLQILCPNCHAQTPNHSGKNIKNIRHQKMVVSTEEILKAIPSVFNIRQLLKHFGLSAKGGNYNRIKFLLETNPNVRFKIKIPKESNLSKIEWPSPKELQSLLWQYPTTQIAQQLKVSDKAIEKRAKKFNLSKPPRGYWAKVKSKTK